MPFHVDLPAPPPPPPLGGMPMMNGVPPAAPRFMEEEVVDTLGVIQGLEAEKRHEEKRYEGQREQEREEIFENVQAVRGGGRIRPRFSRRQLFQAMEGIDDPEYLGEDQDHVDEVVKTTGWGKGVGKGSMEEIEEVQEVRKVQEVEEVVKKARDVRNYKERSRTTFEPTVGPEVSVPQPTVEPEPLVASQPEREKQAEMPVKSRKEGRLARKEKRVQKMMMQYLQEVEAGPEQEELDGTREKMLGLNKLRMLKKVLEMQSMQSDLQIDGILEEYAAAGQQPEIIQDSGHLDQVKAELVQKMEELKLDPPSPPPLTLPMRGTISASPKTSPPAFTLPMRVTISVSPETPKKKKAKSDAPPKMSERRKKEKAKSDASPKLSKNAKKRQARLGEISGQGIKTGQQSKEIGNNEALEVQGKTQLVASVDKPEVDSASSPAPMQDAPSSSPRTTKSSKSTFTTSEKAVETNPEPPFEQVAQVKYEPRFQSTPGRNRYRYKNSWALPLPELPTRKPKPTLPDSVLKALVGGRLSRPTPESILRRPQVHPSWVVQKAALQKKFGRTAWLSHTKISPGTVGLIKAITAEAPRALTATEIATKFNISWEAARRILKSKWTPKTDEDKEKRMRKWLERGGKIKMAQMESGEIWTKEKRKDVWEMKQHRMKKLEIMARFGIQKGRPEGEEGIERSMGRINWEGKIL